MPLKIPDGAACLIPGCRRAPTLALSIRLRRRDTSAVWCPETHAYVCDLHGEQGADIEIMFRENVSGEIATRVVGVSRRGFAERTTPIRA